MENITDDRGYNQIWAQTNSSVIRAERRADVIINNMSLDKSKKILEIGCGQGSIANYIAQKTGLQYLATDLCEPFIDDARKRYNHPNLSFEVMDFNRADQVAGRTFDYIIGNGILHHLYHNLDAALKRINTLLNENGKLIFWEPNLYNPYVYLIFSYPALREKAHLEPDEMAFSKPFIQEKIKNAGFKSSMVEYRDFLLPGIPDSLIKPSIAIGNIAEKTPLVKMVAQSLFIVGIK